MSNKNEAKTGTQKIVFNLFSNISFPVKALAATAGIAGLSYGTALVKDMGEAPPTRRVENVQVADAETKAALKEILLNVRDTREKVIWIEGKVENIDERSRRNETGVQSNEDAIREMEKGGRQ